MAKLAGVIHRLGIIGEFFTFLWRVKLWWMIPIFGVIFLFGFLLVLSQTSTLMPSIYTLF